MRRALGLLVIVVLFSPYVLSFFHGQGLSFDLSSSDINVFAFTLLQAFLSSLASLVFGFFAALGLIYSANRYPVFYKWILRPSCLLPNVVPVIMVILASLKVIDPFPFGFVGILLLHTLMNLGIVALSIQKIISNKLSGLSEVSALFGASRAQFLFRGGLQTIFGDLAMVGLFVFAICYSSFAIPLVVGGSQFTTIEVLIFEQIRLEGDWAKASFLALLQAISIFVLCYFIPQKIEASKESFRRNQYLSSRIGIPIALIPALIIIIGLFGSFSMGIKQFLRLDLLRAELPGQILNSLVVAIGTGLFSFLLFNLIAFVFYRGTLKKIILSYAAPSTVICGFAFLIFGPQGELSSLIRMILGISLISVPALIRLQFANTIYSLERQREVAVLLGASEVEVFKQVVFPQSFFSACFLSGIASFWAWGDFALSSIVADRPHTVALVIQALMTSYRLELAVLLLWLLLICGILTFALFSGIGYVYHKKLIS